MSRRAKIVATLGPATASTERIAALIAAGLDVARLNLSHGHYADHQLAYDRIRQASDAAGRSVGVLADLQGPKIRLGTFPGGPVRLVPGEEFTITVADVPGDRHEASTTYQGLAQDVRPGDRVLIDDGRVLLEVAAVTGDRVRTVVRVGGTISDHKGINLPGVPVSAPALTPKDQADLRWAIGLGVDLVALSFVRHPEDADAARRVMDEYGVRLPLIAKIEKPEAVAALPEIVDAFDGIMVARGDLGVELPLEQVPLVQKRAIGLAREKARPVIVATQMLESMIFAPRPTRAEVSDVATAVDQGADAVMLSAETSVGEYPVEAVATMSRVVCAAEEESLRPVSSLARVPTTTGGAIARAAAEVGAVVGARALVAFTADRGDRPAAGPVPLADPAAGLHLIGGHPQPALADLGRRDVHRARGHPHRRDGPPGRGRAAHHRPAGEGRQGGDRGGQPARQPGQDQRAAGAPDRRRRGPALRLVESPPGS